MAYSPDLQNNISENNINIRLKDILYKTEFIFFDKYKENSRDIRKDIYEIRIINPNGSQMTFEEIGKYYNVKRQRIDQLDKEIKAELRNIFNSLFKEQLLQDTDIDLIDKNIIDESKLLLLKNCVFPLFVDTNTGVLMKDEQAFNDLHSSILLKFQENIIYSRSEIYLTAENIITNKYKILNPYKRNNIISGITNTILDNFICFAPTEPDNFILDCHNKHKSKNIKLEYFFKKLYPNGVDLPQKKEDLFEQNIQALRNAIPEEEAVPRRLYQKITELDDVICINFGKFIHIDNVQIENGILDDILNRCEYLFSKNINSFETKALFEIFNDELIYKGIQNYYMLHSLLKHKNSDKIIIKKGNCTQIINPALGHQDIQPERITNNSFVGSKYYEIIFDEKYPKAEDNFRINTNEDEDKRRLKNKTNEYETESQSSEEEDIDKIENNQDFSQYTEEEQEDITPNEREQIIKQRVTQGKFRKELIKKYNCKCALCNIQDCDLLIASHIKPWSESDNKEKHDPENGFLLCSWHDALFDKGYISFDDDGEILISPQMPHIYTPLLNFSKDTKIQLSSKNREYLAFHRKNVFRG